MKAFGMNPMAIVENTLLTKHSSGTTMEQELFLTFHDTGCTKISKSDKCGTETVSVYKRDPSHFRQLLKQLSDTLQIPIMAVYVI